MSKVHDSHSLVRGLALSYKNVKRPWEVQDTNPHSDGVNNPLYNTVGECVIVYEQAIKDKESSYEKCMVYT